jgi:xanthine permease XanP
MLSRSLARVRKLWPGWAESRVARKSTRPPGLLYAVDETPPRTVLVVSAFQHVAVNSITLVFPLIIAREAGLVGDRLIDFISLSMLTLGLATILLCARSQFVGSGYLCPAGFSQIYLGPALLALRHGGIALVFGMTAASGIIQVSLAPMLRRLRALLPSEIAGLVIAIVGLSLALYGFRFIFGITTNQGVKVPDLAVATITLLTMVVLNIWTEGYTKIFCVLIGIAVGYAMSVAVGVLDIGAVIPKDGLGILRVPRFQNIGWTFDINLIAPFVVATIATTLRTMGDISNAQRINDADWVRPNFGSLVAGIAANGFATMFCGILGTSGVNSNSSSVGLSRATGITSRIVGVATGICFALLSFFPIMAAGFAAMPPPVMGATLFFTSAFVFTSGLQVITARLLDSRKIIVIGFSFAMAMIADIYHDVLAHAPAVFQPILDNGLVLGTVCAVFLNLIMRIGVRKRVSIRFPPGAINREAVEQFLSEQGAHWAARRDVMQRAMFGVMQSLDVLEHLQGDTEIEASFDEFNLDIRIRYAGAPMVIPELRPSPREIVTGEGGERLLAGYLLRRSADRISSRKSGERAELHLHYDH